jgi:Rad3-related DNA helicase
VSVNLLAHFPLGATARPAQARLLAQLGDAIAEAEDDTGAPRIFLVEAPPGVGKSHVAMALARWSGDAYLLTSQKLLQDQYEREFGDEIQVVKGRDNYRCERYPDARVPTSQGMCRRPGGPPCQCPYVRAKVAALAGAVFCTNTAYFATLRQWHAAELPRRRLLIVDEAHNLEGQLLGVLSVPLSREQMKEWFGTVFPRLESADDYRPLIHEHLPRMRASLTELDRALDTLRPAELLPDDFLRLPPSREEQRLLRERDELASALARLRRFIETADEEWVVRHDAGPAAAIELVPLRVASLAPALLEDTADLTLLSSAYLGRREVLAACFGLDETRVRAFSAESPFALEQRPLVYRPVGRLSRETFARLEPALIEEVATILAEHRTDKGLIHVASHAAARRLAQGLADRAPEESRRLILVDANLDRAGALVQHRVSPHATVLLSPSLREGVDLPDDFLRFQIVTKLPYPDLGDPWTAARRQQDTRWYATETAKALVQAYGRSCRNAEDHGTTYVLDGQFERFLTAYRSLLPAWFLDAADVAMREHWRRGRAPRSDAFEG